MKVFRWRRPPDPHRPGTVYRSKPALGRAKGLASGPPYLPGSLSGGGAGGAAGSGPPASGVDAVYSEYGGRSRQDRDGQVFDDRGWDDARPGRTSARATGTGTGQGTGTGAGTGTGPGTGPLNGFDGGSGTGRSGGNRTAGAWPDSGSSGGYRRPPPGYEPPLPAAPRRRRGWWRPRLSLIVLLLVLALIGYPLMLGLTAWKNLNRVDALAPAHAVTDTADSPGRTFLVVGSDSRADLSAAERKRLGTGGVAGQRTDTIMILHVPTGGGPTVLVSVPRDSYVPIPGHGHNKINAAYAFGGAPLLVRTLEQVSGIRIDEYVETGLGGFANVVDALGGVVLCPTFAMNDKDAHINLKKGCQLMDGKTALGYARARHSDPRGDLGRVERQRETLAAIAKKTLGPGTLVQPWRAFPAATAGGGALTVDSGTTPLGLYRFMQAMRAVAGGTGISLTVPVSNPNLSTSAGSAVQWDRAKALALFRDIRTNDTSAIKALAAEQKR